MAHGHTHVYFENTQLRFVFVNPRLTNHHLSPIFFIFLSVPSIKSTNAWLTGESNSNLHARLDHFMGRKLRSLARSQATLFTEVCGRTRIFETDSASSLLTAKLPGAFYSRRSFLFLSSAPTYEENDWQLMCTSVAMILSFCGQRFGPLLCLYIFSLKSRSFQSTLHRSSFHYRGKKGVNL